MSNEIENVKFESICDVNTGVNWMIEKFIQNKMEQ